MSLLSVKAERRRNRGISFSHVVAFLGGMTVATLFMTFFHGTILHATGYSDPFATGNDQPNLNTSARSPHIATTDTYRYHSTPQAVAGLDCSAHGGPNTAEITQELVYWKDLPLDNEYISPLRSTTVRQYLTFEPDGGELTECWKQLHYQMVCSHCAPLNHSRRLEQYPNVNGNYDMKLFLWWYMYS